MWKIADRICPDLLHNAAGFHYPESHRRMECVRDGKCFLSGDGETVDRSCHRVWDAANEGIQFEHVPVGVTIY